ncbi:MAG TPA: hypothetical protein VGQ93_16225 [Lysobacter sp.]|nr:hypothetical protein [Lysobacter sp.]
MKQLSKTASHGLFVALLALMLATRFHHFGTALHLPDASMVIFFLGGLYLRKHCQFAVFVVLAGVIDWAAISLAGGSDFCVTPAYSFLLPAYAVLWSGGRLYADRLQMTWKSVLGAFAVALVSASLSFAISNGAFYWLGGRYTDTNFAEYVARAWEWGPLFVRTTMAYIAGAAIVHALIVRVLAARETGARA